MKLYEEVLNDIQEAGFVSGIANAAKEGAKEETKNFFTKKSLKSNIMISAAFVGGFAVISAIFKSVRAQLSSAYKRCGSQGEGPGYKVCVNREKLKILNVAIEQLNGARAKCKNNAECQNKIQSKIEDLRNKILIAHNELEAAQNEINTAKIENRSYRKVTEGAAMSAARGAGGIAAQVILFSILDKMLAPVFKLTKEAFSEAERKCSSIDDGPAKELCKARIKMIALQRQAAQLSNALNTCNAKSGHDKSKCLKYSKKLNTTKEQIKIFQDNIEIYRQALRNSFTATSS